MDWESTNAPDAAEIERLASKAIEELPQAFQAHVKDVALRVEEFATDEVLDDLEIDNAFGLTGLYDGTPLTAKSSADQPDRPDTIWLYRRPLLDEWCERGDVTLGELVAHVVVHELAHHFGWSDEDIATIDEWWT